jgi:LCP family protein required for cell wall assembly
MSKIKTQALIIFVMLILVISPSFAAAEGNEPATEESQWWNILLLGGDSLSKTGYERTDSIIILSINKADKQIKMTSIMRDTWVSFPGLSRSGKINAANVYGGPELSMETVNACFGMDVEDYVLINMVGLIEVIDEIGGVEIPVTESERKLIGPYAKGYLSILGTYDGDTTLSESGDSVQLNGLQAMSYCRIRSIGTDYARTQRQRTVLLAAFEKLKQGDVAQVLSVVRVGLENTKTNLGLTGIYELANIGLAMDQNAIEQYRIPADGTFESGMKNGTWSIRPDFEANRELLREFIYGAD